MIFSHHLICCLYNTLNLVLTQLEPTVSHCLQNLYYELCKSLQNSMVAIKLWYKNKFNDIILITLLK